MQYYTVGARRGNKYSHGMVRAVATTTVIVKTREEPRLPTKHIGLKDFMRKQMKE